MHRTFSFFVKYGRQKLKPGTISSPLAVPSHIPRPPYIYNQKLAKNITEDENIPILPTSEWGKMRESGSLASHILTFASALVQPGITTDEIDKKTHEEIIKHGAYPSPLNYRGFPKSICTSVNECICHGIPDSRPLQEGDIISLDVTIYKDGYHGDTCKTVIVPGSEVSKQHRKNLEVLLQTSYDATWAGIRTCSPGESFRTIGKEISSFVKTQGFSVVEELCGHGIGRQFHAPPPIFFTENESQFLMKPGMAFTIEPIICDGSAEIGMWDDGWTVVSTDRSPSSQFEHTILITETGYEVLTLRKEEIDAGFTIVNKATN